MKHFSEKILPKVSTFSLQNLIQSVQDLESEKSKVGESVEELAAAIEQQSGDAVPCRRKASKVEEHFISVKERLEIRLHDFGERKDVLERIIKAVDSANECCVRTTAKLSEMVASKPDLPECKKQIKEIEVSPKTPQFKISSLSNKVCFCTQSCTFLFLH